MKNKIKKINIRSSELFLGVLDKKTFRTKILWSGCLIEIPRWKMAQEFMRHRNEVS